jgi:hypothetical protein
VNAADLATTEEFPEAATSQMAHTCHMPKAKEAICIQIYNNCRI